MGCVESRRTGRSRRVSRSRFWKILSLPVYKCFGPTLAAEYLAKKHRIEARKETVRQWMIRGKLWRAEREKVRQVHIWRPRRSRFGELVQWDTSEHDWLEGRGEKTLSDCVMIDDATQAGYGLVSCGTIRRKKTCGCRGVIWRKFGRPNTFYTDKASLFHDDEKRQAR